MINFLWSAFATTFITGFVRAAGGWLINSYADQQIQAAEWKKLAITFVSFLGVGILAALGQNLGAQGMEVIGIIAGFLVNELWSKLDKKKNK